MTQMIVQLDSEPLGSDAPQTSDVWAASLTVRGRADPGDSIPDVEAQFVGRVRRITEARLNLLGLETLTDSLLLIVSEIVTNAVEQAGCDGPGSVTFTQRLAGGRLRIEVSDTGCGQPEVKPLSATEESGRGLHLVANLTGELGGRWGFDPEHRTTWIDLPTPPAG
ncbi:ATP-binding protein [Streptomyces sp. NPDC054904]|uniref:ATP-binding protein n=1 Tax=unclassified Streptomyces TaxID=2593676 RepID=UPI0037AD827E